MVNRTSTGQGAEADRDRGARLHCRRPGAPAAVPVDHRHRESSRSAAPPANPAFWPACCSSSARTSRPCCSSPRPPAWRPRPSRQRSARCRSATTATTARHERRSGDGAGRSRSCARDDRPLLVVDVDDVLMEFVRPFMRYPRCAGLDTRPVQFSAARQHCRQVDQGSHRGWQDQRTDRSVLRAPRTSGRRPSRMPPTPWRRLRRTPRS